MTPTAKGFAMKTHAAGVIDVRTVSPTQRAAKVNALALYSGHTPTEGWSDAVIEREWLVFAGAMRCFIIAVSISEDLS